MAMRHITQRQQQPAIHRVPSPVPQPIDAAAQASANRRLRNIIILANLAAWIAIIIAIRAFLF